MRFPNQLYGGNAGKFVDICIRKTVNLLHRGANPPAPAPTHFIMITLYKMFCAGIYQRNHTI